ncbi:MAG: GNAT family N-acetyltransferase [Anaerolineae bacterium]
MEQELPVIRTERLVLRPFDLSDAADVRRLASDRAVASTTLNIPHPYPNGAAEQWIGNHVGRYENREIMTLAVTLRASGELAGCISLRLNDLHSRAELGYWMGVPYWNQGYCSEAARALVGYGFEQLGLNRIYAHHLTRNPASGRVMQKAGMVYEGTQRQHVQKWDRFEDLAAYGILRSDYEP